MCPAADHTLLNLFKEVSIIKSNSLGNPTGETPPIEYPVISLALFASGLITVPLIFKIFGNLFVLHFLSPATKVTTGISSLSLQITKTSVLTIAPTGTLSEFEASIAVFAVSASSITSSV